MRWLVTILVPFAIAACAKTADDRAPVTSAEATQIAEGAEASFTKGDAKAIMAQYASDAVMIDASSPDPSADRKVQSGWTQTFVSMQPARLQGGRPPHPTDRAGRVRQFRDRDVHGCRRRCPADGECALHRCFPAQKGWQLEDRQRACLGAAAANQR